MKDEPIIAGDISHVTSAHAKTMLRAVFEKWDIGLKFLKYVIVNNCKHILMESI